jgi:hypothetical protein
MKFNAASAPAEGGVDFPKLQLKKDEKARVCIPSTKGWEATVRHWVVGVGYVHCHALQNEKVVTPADLYKIQEEMGRPDECIMCAMSAKGNEKVGAPSRRFAVRVLRYKTDYDGRLSPGGLKYWLEIWIIDNRKFRELRGILDEWGGAKKDKINQHDLGLVCEDPKYQNMTITVKKEAAWLQDKEGVKAYLPAEAAKFDLMECLGAVMDKDALQRRFAIAERRTAKEAPIGLEEEDVVPGDKPEAQAEATSEEDIFKFKDEEGKEKKEGDIPPVEEGKEEKKDFLDDL